MISILAKADLVDHSVDLPLILGSVFVVATAALLAFFPIRTAGLRHHRYADALVAASLLWACLAAGSVIYMLIAQAKYTSDHNELMANGFLDYDDRAAAPAWPWLPWAGLLAAYIILLVVCSRGKKMESQEPPPGEPS